MYDREKSKTKGGVKRPARERLLEHALNPRIEKLTRYEKTVTALEKVFAPDEIFLSIYEDMFNNDEIARLCTFLGIDFVDPDFDKQSNVSPRTDEPKPEDVAKIRDFYADTYAFCRARFGAERIDRLWGADATAAPAVAS